MAFPKKKLTKKELKALNHAKVVAQRQGGSQMPSQPNNVVQLNTAINKIEKKAA